MLEVKTVNSSEVVRPTNTEDLVGLENVKNSIKYAVLGAKRLNETIPHFIIAGPPGCSKTTTARIIGSYSGGQFYQKMGFDLKTPSDIDDIRMDVNDNDVVFIEEAHTMHKKAQVALLTWLEQYKVFVGEGPGEDAPHVCFIFATTNPGKLSKPLRDRCEKLYTSYYKITDLEEILARAGSKLGLDLRSQPDALRRLAKSSRGTPRIAINSRLGSLRKVMIVDGLPYNLDTVNHMLQLGGINEWGLEKADIEYCHALAAKLATSNRSVSKQILTHTTGFDEDFIDIIEMYLNQIGAITISSSGRSLTPFGYEIIGIKRDEVAAVVQGTNTTPVVDIDMKKLADLIEDPQIRKSGMKYVAGQLGLCYGVDNAKLQAALNELGYRARRRIGIEKITAST